MKNYKTTFKASVLTLLLGSSCCWLSSLVVWIGGATLVGTLVHLIETMQMPLISIGILLLIVSMVGYLKMRNKNS